MYGASLKLLQLLEGSYKPRADELPLLSEVARLNKLHLAFLRAVRDSLPGEWASEEERFKSYVRNSLEVAGALRGLRYGFYKFRRPVDHVSVDLDLLIHVDDVGEAVRRLTARGFRIAVPEPYTVTLGRGGFIVDLYTHPAFAWVVYMDGWRLLRDYAEDFEVEGVAVRGLAREAEVAVAAAHAVYKEHMVLLIDCLTLERWLSRRAVEASRELGVERALWAALSACRSIRAGSAEAPYRLPLPLLAGAYADKTLSDAWFRGTLPNALRYLAGREGAGRVLLSRLTRRSY